MLTSRSHHPLFLPFFIALIGAAFSAWNALDAASVPCVTTGCTLYQNFSFGGFSLWWVGTGAFLLLGLLALGAMAASVVLWPALRFSRTVSCCWS